MIQKPFDKIDKSDIETLITNEVRESRTIEYKQELPGNSSHDKYEFLADVSSFANAVGGDLIYGIDAHDGVPKQITGIKDDMDKVMQRLENMIRDGIEPRIPGIRLKPVDGFLQGSILLIHVPRSWSAPHMVATKNSRFYMRTSTGKAPMDVSQIRDAFALTEALPKRMRQFRDERLGRIAAGETFASIREGAKLILHILPAVSFASNFKLDLSLLNDEYETYWKPVSLFEDNTSTDDLWFKHHQYGYNYDGRVAFMWDKAYCQVFRTGQIEAVDTSFFSQKDNGYLYALGNPADEKTLIKAVETYMDMLVKLEVPFPMAVAVSMIGVKNSKLSVPEKLTRLLQQERPPLERDELIFPEELFEEKPSNMSQALNSIFDTMWNAYGYAESPRHKANAATSKT